MLAETGGDCRIIPIPFPVVIYMRLHAPARTSYTV